MGQDEIHTAFISNAPHMDREGRPGDRIARYSLTPYLQTHRPAVVNYESAQSNMHKRISKCRLQMQETHHVKEEKIRTGRSTHRESSDWSAFGREVPAYLGLSLLRMRRGNT